MSAPPWLVAVNPSAGRREMFHSRLQAALAGAGVEAEIEVIPTAAAMTQSVNNSRELVRATCHSSHGNTLRPTSSMKTMNATT